MAAKDTSFSKQLLNCRGHLLDVSAPLVMGILNVTPDSFYDGNIYTTKEKILFRAEQILAEGGSVIDIGGCSTRPGAKHVPESVELERVIPAIEAVIAKFPGAIISVDTFRPEVAEQAVRAGASIINDIYGGRYDEKIMDVAASYKTPYIIMHMKGTPETMQENPQYDSVIRELLEFFNERINLAREKGIHDIIIDPGFGFGKSTQHNFSILKNLETLKITGYPVMAGISRKSMVNKILSVKPENALNGTTVLNTFALLKGANFLRVHDVKEAAEAVSLVGFLQNDYIQRNSTKE